MPDDTTLIRWAHRLGPATVAALNDRAVTVARARQVTRGRTLRSDGTVVETHSRHPTDRKARGDGVRAIGRLLRRATGVLGAGVALGQAAFRTRTRSVRRVTQQLHGVARPAEDLKQAYAT